MERKRTLVVPAEPLRLVLQKSIFELPCTTAFDIVSFTDDAWICFNANDNLGDRTGTTLHDQ